MSWIKLNTYLDGMKLLVVFMQCLKFNKKNVKEFHFCGVFMLFWDLMYMFATFFQQPRELEVVML
jgi:hypothetical protein